MQLFGADINQENDKLQDSSFLLLTVLKNKDISFWNLRQYDFLVSGIGHPIFFEVRDGDDFAIRNIFRQNFVFF